MRWLLLLPLVACGVFAVQSAPTTPAKKLLEFGWDKPRPAQLTTAQLEQSVFDGVVFRNGASDTIIQPEPLPVSVFDQDIAHLQKIKSKKLENSFMLLNVNAAAWDWFNDATWAVAEANLAQMARVAKQGGLRGILFDPEVYQFDLWAYQSQAQKSKYSFAQFESKMRQRGASLMRAYEREYPGITLLFLYAFAAFELPENATYESAHAALETDGSLGLFASFLEGMLEAASDQAVLIDGNEPSYYYLRGTDFDDARKYSLETAQIMVAPALRAKYQKQMRFSNAVYMDGVMNLWDSARFFGYYLKNNTERGQLITHNVYHGLRTTDEFVWVYGENMDWWKRTANNGVDFAELENPLKQGLLEFRAGALTTNPSAAIALAKTAFDARVNIGGDIRGKAGLKIDFGALKNHCGTWNNAQRWSCTQRGGSSFTITPTAANTTFDPPSKTYTNVTKDNWSSHFTAK